jgi:hypothetical protein
LPVLLFVYAVVVCFLFFTLTANCFSFPTGKLSLEIEISTIILFSGTQSTLLLFVDLSSLVLVYQR